MSPSRLLHQVLFVLTIMMPVGLFLFLIALQYGCLSGDVPERQVIVPTVTLENLQSAYARSVGHQQMYARFSRQAQKERLPGIVDLYRALSRSEAIHARNHRNLLRSKSIEPSLPSLDSIPVGSVIQTIKMAISSEEIEVDRMYPNLIGTAEAEHYSEAVEQFHQTQEADARQMELLKSAQDLNGKISRVTYYVCATCGYIMTSSKTDECPVCHSKQETFEKI